MVKHIRQPVALYVHLPLPTLPGPRYLSFGWEDENGDFHAMDPLYQAPDYDLEAMGRQVMKAWVTLARRALDGT